MARAAASRDVFNAVGESRRRDIVAELSRVRSISVGELAERLGMQQPAVSKHLGVLRRVGLVSVVKDGRLRHYRLDATKLKPIHDWVAEYERFWSNQLDRIKDRAERAARKPKENKE